MWKQQHDVDGWEQVVKCAQPHHHDASLLCCSDAVPLSDAIQVFALANILRRPIVILSCVTPTTPDLDHSQRPHTEDIGGIYLPLLWKPDECIRYPLVLGNVDNTFIPFVGGDGITDLPSALDIVPLVTAQLEPLQVWFLLADEECEVYSLMQRYMNVTEVNLCQAESISMVLGARLKYQQLEDTELTSVTRATVTSRPAAVRFQDPFSTQSSLHHSPAETFTAATQRPGTISSDCLLITVVSFGSIVLLFPQMFNCTDVRLQLHE